MPQREKTQSTHRKWQKKAFSGKSTINNSNKHFNAINGIATVITIQLHFSTFWGTFCKIWLFLLKKNGLNLPPFHKGPFLCSYITKKYISSRAMQLGGKLPYRVLFPIQISLFDKCNIRSFQNCKCKERLPLPSKSWIFSDMLSFEFYVGSMKSNNQITYLWFHQLLLYCIIDIVEHI